jgi:predicted GNAT family acetyltransferase
MESMPPTAHEKINGAEQTSAFHAKEPAGIMVLGRSLPVRTHDAPRIPRPVPVISRFEMPSATVRSQLRTKKVEDGRVVLSRTEVPRELSALGYGSRLALGIFEALRRSVKRTIAKFPFMSSYAVRRREYGALLDG